MCCHFWGIPSIWSGIEASLIIWTVSVWLFVWLHICFLHQWGQVGDRWSLDHECLFHDRVSVVRCGIHCEFSNWEVVWGNRLLGISLGWSWMAQGILGWVLPFSGGVLGGMHLARFVLWSWIVMVEVLFDQQLCWVLWWHLCSFLSSLLPVIPLGHYGFVVLCQSWVWDCIQRGFDWVTVQWWSIVVPTLVNFVTVLLGVWSVIQDS